MSKPPLPPLPLWEEGPARTLATVRIFSLEVSPARSVLHPEKQGEFARIRATDWVNVIALTPEEEVVLVEQYRHGTREITLEIPGGMVDAGESFLEAGRRELREESGFDSDDAREIGVVTPNPAFLSNRCGTILVTNARRVGAPHLDSTEEVRERLVPLREIPSLIRSGQITHALVIAAFHHLHLSRTAPQEPGCPS